MKHIKTFTATVALATSLGMGSAMAEETFITIGTGGQTGV